MKNAFIHIFLLLTLCAVIGCGGSDEGDGTNLSDDGPALSDINEQDMVSEEDDGLCIAGTFKCEGFEVFRCITGGAWVYIEECENGLSCVAAIGGCACVPECDGKTCGPDGCGDTCGECDSKTVCSPAGECTDDCNPDGTGMLLGDHLANVDWNDDDGELFPLHSQCKTNKAIVIMETAEW